MNEGLPPLPDCMPTVNALDQLFRQRHNDDDVIRRLIPVLRQAQKLAIAAHDAKREKVLQAYCDYDGWGWFDADEEFRQKNPTWQYRTIYIEREGA